MGSIRALVIGATLLCACQTNVPHPKAKPLSDCPSCGIGLECGKHRAQTSCAASTPDAALPPAPQVGTDCSFNPLVAPERDALIQGFNVDELDFEYDTQRGEVQLDVPSDVRVAACALFACIPTFDAAHRILNFGQCALVFDQLTGTRRIFDLRTSPVLVPCHDPNDAACSLVFDRLLIGCWAYDATHVAYASRLETADPVDTYFGNSVLHRCTSSHDEGLSCSIPNTLRIGTCHDLQCQWHCQTDQDCEVQLHPELLSTPIDGGVSDADADGGAGLLPNCSSRCQALSTRPDLGLCIPVTP